MKPYNPQPTTCRYLEHTGWWINRPQWTWVVARYTDEVNNSYVIREDPFCVVDAFANVESMMSSNENSDSQIEVKLSGANLGRLILREIGKANLDTAACVGQGYDKASAMASGAAGAAAFVNETAKLADLIIFIV